METKKSTSFYSTSVDKRNKLVEISADTLLYPPKRRRNRLSVSCLNCKRRKVKCDRGRPVCGTCAKNNLPIGSCCYSSYLSIDSIEKTNKLKEIYPEQDFFNGSEKNSLSSSASVPHINNGTNIANNVPMNNTYKPDSRSLPIPTVHPPPQNMHHPYPPFQQSEVMMNNFPPRFPPFNSPSFSVESNTNDNVNKNNRIENDSQQGSPNSLRKDIHNSHIASNPPVSEQNGLFRYPHMHHLQPIPENPSDLTETLNYTSEDVRSMLKQLQTITSEKREMESNYLREIQELKSKLKQESKFKAFPDLFSAEETEESPIFKGLSRVQNLEFEFSSRGYRVEKASTVTYYGPSCWRVNIITDKIFGPTLMSFTDLFKAERRMWKLKFQAETDNLYAQYEVKVLEGVQGDNFKHKYHQNILNALIDILPEHDKLQESIDIFFEKLKDHIYFVPEGVIRYFFKLHFTKSDDNKVKFKLYEEKQDYTRIAAVLLVVKVSQLFYPTSWDDRDLIFWFAEKLSQFAGAKWKATIPAFITEALSYFVKLRNIRLQECGDLKDTSLFATRAIQMALNMGFQKDKNDVMVSLKKTDRGIIDLITEEEWNSMWIFVQFTDAQVAFISGAPPLLASLDGLSKARTAFDYHRMKVIKFYKQVNSMLSFEYNNKNLKMNLRDTEDVILSLEKYHDYELSNVTKESLGIPHCSISSMFISYSLRLKVCDLILSLYLLNHRMVKDEIERKSFKELDEQLQNELLELEQRFTKRAVTFSVIVLTSINHLIITNLGGSEGKKEISAISVELRSLFLKILTCLSSYMIEAMVIESKSRKRIKEEPADSSRKSNHSEGDYSSSSKSPNSNSKVQNLLIDDLDIKSAEALMFPHLSCEKRALNFPDLVITQEKLSLPFQDAKCLLTFLNGFFYNTQTSAIAPVYTFYAIYKYCFLFCVHLKEKVIDEGVDGEWFLKNLNEKEFCERYEAVDAHWFSKTDS